MDDWTPRDGDTFTTTENFVFYVFGYEHPTKRVFSFLKYIPQNFGSLFSIRYLRKTWRLGDVELLRAERLYTAENYKILMETLRTHFSKYVYFCPFRMKEVISAPLDSIKKIFVPQKYLEKLVWKKSKDTLQRLALELVSFLSEQSGVDFEDFGIHGSIALNTHTPKSDIDFVVYGSQNFRRLEKTINKLVLEGKLSHVFTNRIDKIRRHRGRYKGKIFVYNAVRKIGEINVEYGEYLYKPVKPVTFECTVSNDEEAMFRPAIYKILNYRPLDEASELPREKEPTEVVSMIGCYRNIARCGEKIRVSGILERVEHIETGSFHYQVVVGSGEKEEEYIWPLTSNHKNLVHDLKTKN